MIVVLHDALVAATRSTAARIDPVALGTAFVSSLRTRRFEHWSTLASFAVARSLPVHAFEAMATRSNCRICGAHERLLVFESDGFAKARLAGCVRSDSIRYANFDLETFLNEEIEPPLRADWEFFASAIARISRIPPQSKTYAAERALGAIFPASRLERKLFLGALGICGVLDAPGRRGFWPTFVAFEDRAPLDASPYTYPVTWWRREYGLDPDALAAFGLPSALASNDVTACVVGSTARSREPSCGN